MKLGFGAPVSGSWATPGNLAYVARRAEQLGYHSLWTYQRLLSPVDGDWGEMYREVIDPLAPLAFMAAVTERIRLGVAVVNMPFVSPVVLAKALTTVDILSNGRLDAGLGNGWSEEEFVATGADRRRLGARADEYLAVLKRLWTGETVEHQGEFYQVPRMRADPKPVQRPHPPILLGGSAPAALRRAARSCDGWVSSSRADLETIGAAIATMREEAQRTGRDPGSLRFVCRGAVRVRPVAGPNRGTLLGSLEQIREDVAGLAEQGITELVLDLNFDPQIGSPNADPAESLHRADEVLEAFAPTA